MRGKGGFNPPQRSLTPYFKAGSFTDALLTNPTKLFPTECSGWKHADFHLKTLVSSLIDAY